MSGAQLLEYFGEITESINEIQYIFNRLKTPDVDEIKKQMKKVLEANAPELFERIKMKPLLLMELEISNPPNINQFKALINKTDSKLYSFIKNN